MINNMCGSGTGSGSGSGGSGGGSGSSGGTSYNNLSKSEKLDKIDELSDKNSERTDNLMKDVRAGKEIAGSENAKNVVNEVTKTARELDIAKDVTFGYSKEALYSKYGSERKEGYKTSKSDIDKIYNKWK